MTITEAIKQVMRQQGSPMTVGEAHRAIFEERIPPRMFWAYA